MSKTASVLRWMRGEVRRFLLFDLPLAFVLRDRFFPILEEAVELIRGLVVRLRKKCTTGWAGRQM